MSMTGGTVSLGNATYTITGNAAGAITASRQAQGALDQLTKVVSYNWWGIRNLGLAFAALPAAMAGGVGYAIKAAKDWQDSMFQVARTTGETEEELAKIEKRLRAVAATVPIAAKDIAELAAQGAALGVSNKLLGEFSRIMGGLIATTDLTTAHVDEFARVVNILQIPVGEWEQFANVLLEVGRNTAATEPEILNIAKRIAPAAKAANWAAHEVLGLSAAVMSLGPRAEAGGTAINKTIGDMARAVSAGVSDSNKELNLFADVSGRTAEQFVQAFEDAPAELFGDFMTGLGLLKGGYKEQIRVLDALGIVEVRQVLALSALSGGTRSLGDEQRNLNDIFGATGKYLRESNAILDLTTAKAKTLSGQMELLKNIVDQNAATFGNFFLPIIGEVLNVLGNMIMGFQELPGPLKTAILIVTGLVGVLSALAAAFILVVPRIMLARDAFHKIQTAMLTFRLNADAARRTMTLAGVEAEIMAGRMTRAAAIQQGLVMQARAANGAFAAGLVAGPNLGKNAINSAGMGKGMKAGLAGTVALLAGTVALGVATNKLGKEQRDNIDIGEDLTDETLNISDATKEANEALLEGEDNAKKAAKAARELQERLEALAQAHLDLVDAQRGQEAAVKAAQDAERDYKKVLAENHDTTRDLRRAELELESARHSHRKALEDLEDAEYDLANAREIAQDRIVDLEHRLADAQDRQINTSERIRDLEEELAGLRGADRLEKIVDATNDLRNAELKLARAHQTVKDAEWQLQYLREEGASIRDIEDAEMDLAEARQAVADSENDVGDATRELNELRDETALAREIARIEREIAAAHRDVAAGARDVTQMERDLNEMRQSFADGSYILEFQNDYAQALLDVEGAILSVRQAELDLEDQRNGSAAREISDAYDQYEEALYGVAKANVAFRKQQALARGEIFDSGDEAHALADELRKLADALPEGDLRNKFLGMADTLSRAPDVPAPVKESDSSGGGGSFDPGDYGLPSVDAMSEHLAGLLKTVEDSKPEAKKAGFKWGDTLIGAINGGMAGAMVGSVVPGVGTVAGAIVGALIGALAVNFNLLWAYFKDEVGPDFYEGLLVIGDFFSGLKQKVKDWFTEYFINPIKTLFWMYSPSRLMAQIGRDIMQGFLNGISSMLPNVMDISRNIKDLAVQGFNTASSWLSNAGAFLIGGFMNGVRWVSGEVGTIAGIIKQTLSNTMSGAGGWLYDAGKSLIQGLRDGILWAFDNWLKPIWNWIVDKLPADMGKGWRISSPSKVFDDMGSYLMQGLVQGIKGEMTALDRTLQNAVDLVNASMDTAIPSASIDALMRQPDFLATGSYAKPPVGATEQQVTNYYNDTFNLETHTDADAQEIVGEYIWSKGIRARSRG